MISQETVSDMAFLYRDIQAAERLLAEVRSAVKDYEEADIRDAFGRRQRSLEMSIPSGENVTRIMAVPYDLAIPVIEATIANHRAKLMALNEKAKSEVKGG